MLPASVRENKNILASGAIFLVFLSYYLWTSSVLPQGAGPDYRSNNEATAFIFDHHRLAVLPDDEEQVYFTAHGGTRVLRPPLSYIVSAAVAKLYPTDTSQERFIAFRKGSSLLAAAAVAICFYGLLVLFESPFVALIGAALFGLLPQFTFIASYSNDDSGAIFAGTLLFALMAVIYRRGLSPGRFALLGLATGLAILAKFSAWLVLPFVLTFAGIIMLTTLKPRQWLGYGSLAAVMAVIGGGWWILFNIYHYGISDPVAWKIQQVMIDKHRTLDVSQAHGYAAIGIGFSELWFDNYKNFIGETFKSAVGNLDWLRLRVGPLQYLLYQIVLWVAIGYYLLRLAGCVLVAVGRRSWRVFDRRLLFETLLFAAILFQFFMYTWTNIRNDIQIQGKYLLPILMAVLLLFFLAVDWIRTWVRERTPQAGARQITLTSRVVSQGGLIVVVIGIVAVHLDALINYVVPFYNPPLYNIKVGNFRPVASADLIPVSVNNLDVIKRGREIELRPTGADPWVVWSSELCGYVQKNTVLRFTLEATQRDQFQVYMDEGDGFTERRSVKIGYEPGSRETMLSLAVNDCRQIRFDPAMGQAPVVLRDIGVSRLHIGPRR